MRIDFPPLVRRLGIGVPLALSLGLCLVATGKASPQNRAAIAYRVPDGWVKETPMSRMRYAQFKLPTHLPEHADAELAVYYFGGGGGSARANVERWISQMKQPDSSAAHRRAEVQESDIRGMKATVLKLSGIYRRPIPPRMQEIEEKPGYRMVAAVLETAAGPFFFKLIGPEPTVKQWENSFQTFLESIELQN